MSKYVQVSVFGEGYHSGTEYWEGVILTKEIWEKIKDEIGDTISLGELDGKHSDVQGTIDVDFLSEDDMKEESDCENDGDDLYYEIINAMRLKGYNSPEEIIEKIDHEVNQLIEFKLIEVKMRIRKDKVEEFYRCIEQFK